MTYRTLPTDEYPEPPDDAFPPPPPPVLVPAAVVASTMQTLDLLSEFFRCHASTATRAELRIFAGRQGWDPVQGAEVLVESIGLDSLSLGWARAATPPEQTDPAPSSIVDHPSGDAAAAPEHRPARPTTAHPDAPRR